MNSGVDNMKVFNDKGEMNQEAVDVLYELGNVGVATAVMPIGNLREIKISVDTPDVITVENDVLSEIDYDPNQVVIGVATEMNNTLKGSILFFLSKEFIKNSIYEMTEMEFSDDELLTNEDCYSAIQEIVNYMTAGYAKVIGSYLKVPVYMSKISIGFDKISTIIHNTMKNSEHNIEKIACVNTRFTIIDEKGNNSNESGQVLIFPDNECIEKFIEIMEE